MQAVLIFEVLPNFSDSLSIYIANSLVGASTNIIGPSPLFTKGYALIWTIEGNKNASVFPLPVSEIPIRSCPLKTTGNAKACIGEGFSNLAFPISFIIYGGKWASDQLRKGDGTLPWGDLAETLFIL